MLRPYQVKLKQDIYAAEGNVLAVLPTGGGKCLGRGTPVMMFDGTVRPVEEVRQYDLLRGPDNHPRVVMSLARGRETMYRVTPTKGESWTCNESHILSLKLTPDQRHSSHRTVNMSVLEYLKQNNTFKHRAKLWRAPAEYPAVPVPLDPYFLGLWLGDGTRRCAQITKPDLEVRDCVREIAEAHDCEMRESTSPSGNCPQWSITTRQRGRGRKNPVYEKLRNLGVTETKNVPSIYMYNTREVRAAVLAGMLDSDGSLGHSGYDWISISLQMANDIVRLARSLGLAAYLAPARKTCQTGSTGDYWRVSISGDCSFLPMRIPRKKAPKRQQIKDVLVTGFKLEKLPEDEYFGFEIFGPDRLFLLGDFTVTHNTVVLSEIVRERDAPIAIKVHRNEIVSQISLALNRERVPHSIIAPKQVVTDTVRAHIEQHGHSYYRVTSPVRVAGVDTLISRDLDSWAQQVQLVIVDEAHHVQDDNKWAKAIGMFPRARVYGFTAHAIRGDGGGLGRGHGGVFDSLAIGPCGRDLIEDGYLVDYELRCPPSQLTELAIPTGKNGDFSMPQLRKATQAAQITGDVVDHYLRFAGGMLGLTFAVDLERAAEIAAEFNRRGVPAADISGEMAPYERAKLMRRFRSRELLQLVSVDVLGEGVDAPNVQVVSFARKTNSFQLLSQQLGRGLRVDVPKEHAGNWQDYSAAQRRSIIASSNKPRLVVLDHVGNMLRHAAVRGMPDSRQRYSLEGEMRRASSVVSALRVCLNATCLQAYKRELDACPYCKTARPEPAQRSAPEQVEGDLLALDPEVLASIRAAVDRAFDMPQMPYGAAPVVLNSIKKNHREKCEAQTALRDAIALWAGHRVDHMGLSEHESYRCFYRDFGTDVLSAQLLTRADADKLRERIETDLRALGVVRA